jgi:hypothetical protein
MPLWVKLLTAVGVGLVVFGALMSMRIAVSGGWTKWIQLPRREKIQDVMVMALTWLLLVVAGVLMMLLTVQVFPPVK